MISNILNITSSEKQILENNKHLINEQHPRIDYKNKICVKPWGHEFLVYQTSKIGIWFLNIKKGHATSLHSHFNKDSIIIVLKGSAKINLINDEIIHLGPMHSIYLPKYNYHGLSCFSEEVYLLEIEVFNENINYSDKNDLLRISDIYNRENKGYESSVKILDKEDELENYGYFCLQNGFTKKIADVNICVNEISDDKYYEIFEKSNYNILLDGIIFKDMNYYREGSFIESLKNIQLLNNKALILSLEKDNYLEDNKLIYSLEHLELIINTLKQQNEKIILSSGCYDILHVGHLNTLREAKKLGSKLMVCLSSDKQIKALKGKDRPINNFQDRLDLFKTISYIDYIIIYDEENISKESTLGKIMKIVDPFYWVKGSDYTEKQIFEKHPYLKKIKIIDNIDNKSTTNIIKKISNNI